MKTGYVALVLCLNIGVDPPDVIKITPCARMLDRYNSSLLPDIYTNHLMHYLLGFNVLFNDWERGSGKDL